MIINISKSILPSVTHLKRAMSLNFDIIWGYRSTLIRSQCTSRRRRQSKQMNCVGRRESLVAWYLPTPTSKCVSELKRIAENDAYPIHLRMTSISKWLFFTFSGLYRLQRNIPNMKPFLTATLAIANLILDLWRGQYPLLDYSHYIEQTVIPQSHSRPLSCPRWLIETSSTGMSSWDWV